MLFPSTSISTFAIGVMAVLMVVNWFIWGLNKPRDLRHPSTVTPLSGRELVGLVFGRTTAKRRAIVSQDTARDDGGSGFKHVA